MNKSLHARHPIENFPFLYKFHQLTRTRWNPPSSFQRQSSNGTWTSTIATTTTITSTATTTSAIWVWRIIVRRIMLIWRSRRCRMRRVIWWSKITRTQPPGAHQLFPFHMKTVQISVSFLQLIDRIDNENREKWQQQAAIQLCGPHRYRLPVFCN